MWNFSHHKHILNFTIRNQDMLKSWKTVPEWAGSDDCQAAIYCMHYTISINIMLSTVYLPKTKRILRFIHSHLVFASSIPTIYLDIYIILSIINIFTKLQRRNGQNFITLPFILPLFTTDYNKRQKAIILWSIYSVFLQFA